MLKARRVLRESNETLKEGYGFDNQREDCLKFEIKHGLEVIKDHSLVETSSSWNREKFQKIIDEAIKERGEIPAIEFPRVDRFARNLEAAGYYLGLLHQNGLTVMFAQEDLMVDNETSVMHVLMFFIHSFKADQDGKQIRRNILGGRDKLAIQAHEVPNGMVIWPFDYFAKRLYGRVNATGRPILNQEKVNWVIKWANWILEEGIGINEVCRRVNEAGVLTRRTSRFSPKAIRDILRSRQLIGEFWWKGELYLEDETLGIFNEEKVKALQKRLDENRQRSYYNASKHDYPPLRRMVFCGCGPNRILYGKPVRSTTWYYCPKCKTQIRCQVIWDEVQQEIKALLSKEDRLIPAIKSQLDSSELIGKKEQELKYLDERIVSLYDKWDVLYKWASPDYPKDRFKKRELEIIDALDKAKAERERTEHELDVLKQRRIDHDGIMRFCRLVAQNVDYLTKQQWEMLLKVMRLKITVYSKKAIAVSIALPPVRDEQIEYNRL
ncbi:recombinase family protein [Chloroflexota bacterium]